MNTIKHVMSNDLETNIESNEFVSYNKIIQFINEKYPFLNSDYFEFKSSKLKSMIRNVANYIIDEIGESVVHFVKWYNEEYGENRHTIDTYKPINNVEKLIRMSLFSIHYRQLLQIMDLDIYGDKNIIETPERVAKMYFNELYRGLYDKVPSITLFENDKNINDIIFEGPIRVYGGCSHHMVMVDGVIYIGYIPKNKLVGISKLGRIAKHIMARPLIQEDAINLLKNTLINHLETEDIAIYMSGEHYCTKSRGLKDQDSVMITSTMGGVFYTNENEAKDEFMQLVKTAHIANV